MTVLIIAQLICDRCEKVYDASPDVIDSASAVRTAASGDGWLIRLGGQGRDLCPVCRAPAGQRRPLGRGERHQAEIVQRYTEWGQPASKIAGALGLSTSAVYAVLTRAGVQRKARGWPKGKRRGPRLGGGARAHL